MTRKTSEAKEIEARLANVSSVQACQTAMGVISYIQDRPPHVQIAALAGAFLLLAKRLKVNPVNVFTYVSNLIHRVDKQRPEFRAINMYMENEL